MRRATPVCSGPRPRLAARARTSNFADKSRTSVSSAVPVGSAQARGTQGSIFSGSTRPWMPLTGYPRPRSLYCEIRRSRQKSARNGPTRFSVFPTRFPARPGSRARKTRERCSKLRRRLWGRCSYRLARAGERAEAQLTREQIFQM